MFKTIKALFSRIFGSDRPTERVPPEISSIFDYASGYSFPTDAALKREVEKLLEESLSVEKNLHTIAYNNYKYGEMFHAPISPDDPNIGPDGVYRKDMSCCWCGKIFKGVSDELYCSRECDYAAEFMPEWDEFIEKTPKDSNWLKAFDEFRETEPYKTAFEEWWKIVKEKEKNKKTGKPQ